jgi:hypothetical protein
MSCIGIAILCAIGGATVGALAMAAFKVAVAADGDDHHTPEEHRDAERQSTNVGDDEWSY